MKNALILLVILAACTTASPGFRGAAPIEVNEGSSRFRIRIMDQKAEVVRTNMEAFPRFEDVSARGKRAVARVSGCTPAWVTGDPAMMIMGLVCNGKPAPEKPRKPISFHCDILGPYRGRGANGLECYER